MDRSRTIAWQLALSCDHKLSEGFESRWIAAYFRAQPLELTYCLCMGLPFWRSSILYIPTRTFRINRSHPQLSLGYVESHSTCTCIQTTRLAETAMMMEWHYCFFVYYCIFIYCHALHKQSVTLLASLSKEAFIRQKLPELHQLDEQRQGKGNTGRQILSPEFSVLPFLCGLFPMRSVSTSMRVWHAQVCGCGFYVYAETRTRSWLSSSITLCLPALRQGLPLDRTPAALARPHLTAHQCGDAFWSPCSDRYPSDCLLRVVCVMLCHGGRHAVELPVSDVPPPLLHKLLYMNCCVVTCLPGT
jgi:hypothetical protein